MWVFVKDSGTFCVSSGSSGEWKWKHEHGNFHVWSGWNIQGASSSDAVSALVQLCPTACALLPYQG